MVAHNVIGRNWIVLLAAVALLIEALRGLVTGSTILFYRTVTRSEDGFLYWTAIWSGVVVGIAALLVVFL